MLTTNLRKVDGSVMLTVPAAILDLLHLEDGATVALAVEGERLIVDPCFRPKYNLEELLAASGHEGTRSEEEQEWLAAPPVGRELL